MPERRNNKQKQRFIEKEALVLDYLPRGKSGFSEEPVAQVIGKEYFSLLEVLPKREFKILDSIALLKEEGDIESIKRRISYTELTGAAQAELENAVRKIVDENEKRFVEFFNSAMPITIRMHQLELLPGFGKKHLNEVLDAREEKPFSSFEDIAKRIPSLPDPKRAIVKRIIIELTNPDEKYRLFVRVFPQKRF